MSAPEMVKSFNKYNLFKRFNRTPNSHHPKPYSCTVHTRWNLLIPPILKAIKRLLFNVIRLQIIVVFRIFYIVSQYCNKLFAKRNLQILEL